MLDLSKSLALTQPTTIFVSHNIAQAVFLADKIVVLAGEPAKIQGTIQVKLPRPRDSKTSSADMFNKTVATVRKVLKESAA